MRLMGVYKNGDVRMWYNYIQMCPRFFASLNLIRQDEEI